MKKNNSDLFSRLTNIKKNYKEDKKNNKGEFSEGSLKIISLTPTKMVAEGVHPNGKKIMQDKVKFLERIDQKELLNNINLFRNFDLESVSDDKLRSVLGDIICFNIFNTLIINEGTPIYRARNHTFKFETATDYFKSAKDVWYPDAKFLTKLGRLNKIHQPIMYASFDAITTIHEIRSQNDSQFALMKYQVKSMQQLKMMCIATEESTPLGEKIVGYGKLPKKAKQNWRIINNFLVSEFTKKVPVGKEYMYRSTNELLRSFDMPDCDGFIYPSMERLKGYNLAIKPFAADRAVDFCGLAYFYNDTYSREYGSKDIRRKDFYVHQYWSKSTEKGKIVYEPIGPCKIDFHKALNIEEETEYFD